MNEEQLFKMYEKLYYHEIDIRERLNSRLQIPLTIIAILLGCLSFLIRNKCVSVGTYWEISFWVLFAVSAVAALGAVICFILSLYSPVHKLLPTALDTEGYKSDLIELYKNQENKDELVEKYLKEYLYNYYKDYSSFNTGLNDRKAYCLHLTNQFLMVAVGLSFLTFIPYYFGQLDKSDHIKPTKIVIEEPVTIKPVK